MTSPYSMQPGAMQGYGPGQSPGMPAGQAPYARGYRPQPGGTVGRYGAGGTPAYGQQMMGQYPGRAMAPGMGAPGMGAPGMGAPGMGAPGMRAPGMGVPGMGAPGMGVPGIGGRRRPGLAARLAGNQQGSPAGLGQSYQPQFSPVPAAAPPAQGIATKGLRLGRRNQAPGFGAQTPGMPLQVSPMGRTVKPKQFNLTGTGGGTGIAAINDANSFSLIANNLPDPAGMGGDANGGAQPVYMAYLTNRKGQGSFAVGQLYPLGGGTYRANFHSNVPFYDYDQVLVSLENPYSIRSVPTGPIVLTSATGGKVSLPTPVRNFFKGTWEKIKGIGKKKEDSPAAPAAEPQLNLPSLLNNYSLGPPASAGQISTDLPGLGTPAEDPPQGGESFK